MTHAVSAPGRGGRVAAFVLTLNEERLVAGAIGSLKQVTADVAVLDSFSDDATETVAHQAGAAVWKRRFDSFSDQRNYAIERLVDQYDPDWILTIDADERLSPALINELRRVLLDSRHGPAWDAAMIPRQVRFSGRYLRHGTLSQPRLLRLYRPTAGRYEERAVNEHFQLELGGRIGSLSSAILHEDVISWERHIAKHNRYSTLEAQERLRLRFDSGVSFLAALSTPYLRRRLLRERVWNQLPGKPLLRFVQMYFICGGFLDGSAGFSFALFHAWQEMCTEQKFKELLAGTSDHASIMECNESAEGHA